MPCPPARVLSINGRDGHMTVVTQHDGASSRAVLIVALVSAFFLDLVKAVLSPTFIGQLLQLVRSLL
jgi:sodium--glutamate symport carrier gltS